MVTFSFFLFFFFVFFFCPSVLKNERRKLTLSFWARYFYISRVSGRDFILQLFWLYFFLTLIFQKIAKFIFWFSFFKNYSILLWFIQFAWLVLAGVLLDSVWDLIPFGLWFFQISNFVISLSISSFSAHPILKKWEELQYALSIVRGAIPKFS